MGVDQPKVVKLTLVLLLLLTFGLCISSFCTANLCLLSPCYEEIGVDQLYRVDGGESLELVMLSLICFLHVLMAHFVLFKAPFDEMKYGMLVAVTAMLGLIMFLQAVLYGQEATLVKELVTHAAGGTFHDMNFGFCRGNANATACHEDADLHCEFFGGVCQRNMSVNTGGTSKFEAVCAFSVLVSITQFIFSFLLWTWKDEFGSTYKPEARLSTPPTFASEQVQI